MWLCRKLERGFEMRVKTIERLITIRHKARKKADKIRDDLRRKRIIIEDMPGGTRWYRILSEGLGPSPK